MPKLPFYVYNPRQIISALIILFLVLCSSFGTPKVPNFLVRLLNNTVFKILYMTLILVVFKYKPQVAFALSILFLLLLQTINNYHDYIENTKDKLSAHNLAKGLVNSASNSVNDVVSDVGSILTGVSQAISESHKYITKEDFTTNEYGLFFNDQVGPENHEHANELHIHNEKQQPMTQGEHHGPIKHATIKESTSHLHPHLQKQAKKSELVKKIKAAEHSAKKEKKWWA